MQLATSNIDYHDKYQSISTATSYQCDECMHHKTCLFSELCNKDLSTFNSIPKQSKKLARGDYLYRSGDVFDTIYIIRNGSLKNSMIDEEGREQILSFSLQGDMIGLEGLFLNKHITESKALETTFVCGIPLAQYLNIASQNPKLYHGLLNYMSGRIIEEEEHSLMLGTKNSDQRLASFLLSLVKRNSNNGFSDEEITLHMSRRDIGNYLSAAVETVSRIFTRLQDQKLIEVHGKYVRIIDMDGLKKVAF